MCLVLVKRVELMLEAAGILRCAARTALLRRRKDNNFALPLRHRAGLKLGNISPPSLSYFLFAMSEGDRDMETVLKPEQKSLKEQLLKAFKAYDVDAGGVRRRPPSGLATPHLSQLLSALLQIARRLPCCAAPSHRSSRHCRATASSTITR